MYKLIRISLLFLWIGAALWQASPAIAQDPPAGNILLSAIDTTSFPSIQFRMEAFEADGRFVSGLRPQDLQILEDANAIDPDSVEQIDVGLQVTVAFNAQSSMTNQSNGSSHFAQIRTILADWAGALPPDSPDDLSLATPTGLHLIRSREVDRWRETIEGYQPDLARLTPSLTSLADALDLATDPLDDPRMKRAIIFITPDLPPSLLATIPDYASRARHIGVKVFVWMVSPSADPAGDTSGPLADLAANTGGHFQVLPTSALQQLDIESQLKHLRHAYQVQYTSRVQESGPHDLQVKVKRGSLDVTSRAYDLNLTVLPPNPIFLSPPESLNFEVVGPENDQTQPVVTPGEVPLSIVVEFPDQHQRDLKATRLYVNGKLVAENVKPPFDRFVWKIAEISESGPQLLRVEALDSLNLSGASLEIPVNVIVQKTEAKSALVANSAPWLIALGIAVVSGGALTTILLIAARKNRGFGRRRKNTQPRSKAEATIPSRGYPTQEEANAITEPSAGGNVRNVGFANVPNIQRQAASGSTPARLVSLTENEQPVLGGSIPVFMDEITFGSDPELASQVLESSSVDGLHARLVTSEHGDFFLADNASVAGTWINYTPVTEDGMRLEHGDLVHIGRVMFRFELSDPEHAIRHEIVITPVDQRSN